MKSNSNSDRRGIRADSETDDFLLEFDTASADFLRGFECGEIWACLTDSVIEISAIISAGNTEMVMRMAEATGYSFEARELVDSEIQELDLGPGDYMVVVMRAPDDGRTE